MGTVRDVVASMTPEEVLANKEAFKTEVEKKRSRRNVQNGS